MVWILICNRNLSESEFSELENFQNANQSASDREDTAAGKSKIR